MSNQTVELLVVDDEEFNRDVLQEMLSSAGYAVTLAADGEEAWEILDSNKHNFSTILLDRMMPRLDGMGLLARIKADKRFAEIPVIFQTAVDHPLDVVDGIKAGAFYYLIKPIDKNVLFAIVQSAVNSFRLSEDFSGNLLIKASPEQSHLYKLLSRSEFWVCTLLEARNVATALSGFYPYPQHAFIGISELLINAVEHGNLGISYQEKSRLLLEGRWEDEIERRLALPEHAGKKVEVWLENTLRELRLTISDCGEGFDCAKYMEMSAERAFDPNGRGIAMSRKTSFDRIEYKGKGNQVVAVVRI